MAEFDIIKPNFPPHTPPPDPPPEHYKYLASIGLSRNTLLDTCVQEVEITGISVPENTVSLLYDGIEYADVPVWIHTDYGTRRRYIREEEATGPAEYFERAACLFPFAGGIKIGPGTSDVTVTPKALALFHTDQDTSAVTAVAVISVLQSVKKFRGIGDEICFPTWKSYVYLEFRTYRYTVDSADEYDMGSGSIVPVGGSPPYVPAYDDRVVLWDVEAEAIASIPNAGKTDYVVADTHAPADNATKQEIMDFIASGVAEYGSYPGDYKEVYPYLSTDISVAWEQAYDPGPIFSSGGVYVDFDGTMHLDAWNTEANGTDPPETMHVTGSTNWSEVSGNYSGSWLVRDPFFPFRFDSDMTLTLDNWGNVPGSWLYDQDTFWFCTTLNQYRVSTVNAGNYRITCTVDGISYELERYIKETSLDLDAKQTASLSLVDWDDTISFRLFSAVTEGAVEIQNYNIICSTHSKKYNDGTTTDFVYEHYSVVTQKIPKLAFSDSWLNGGKVGFGSLSISSAKAITDVNFDTRSIQDKRYDSYSFAMGSNSKLDSMVIFIESVYSDFSTGDDSSNNPAIVNATDVLPPNTCLFIPDSIFLREAGFITVPYDIQEAQIGL